MDEIDEFIDLMLNLVEPGSNEDGHKLLFFFNKRRRPKNEIM